MAAPKLTLYASLLGNKEGSTPASGATISSAPISYKKPEDSAQSEGDRSNTAPFRFQPGTIKRPQQNAQKPKKKVQQGGALPPPATVNLNSSDASASLAQASDGGNAATSSTSAQRATYSLADWMDDGDDVNEFLDQKRPRKRKKKTNKASDAPREVNWDDFYNIREWTDLEQWKSSVARIRKHNEWKDYLKSHARGRQSRRSSASTEKSRSPRRPVNSSFAPPMSFAPPSFDKEATRRDSDAMEDVREESGARSPAHLVEPRRSADPSGEEAYLQRMQTARTTSAVSDVPSPPPPPPPPPPPELPVLAATAIARAPVRYTLPEAPPELPASDDEMEVDTPDTYDEPQAPSKRPGQKGFAERYMAKLGYQKGQGLGLEGTGITSALSVQKQKMKKRSDAEGGGVVNKVAMGKIVGGKKKSGEDDGGKHGKMSAVVKLEHMVDGMDLDTELGENGSLLQEIGQECGDKYGTVERVYIARGVRSSSKPVFLKFTSELSALRAVNALDGRQFAGNMVTARFYSVDKFESGIYEEPEKIAKVTAGARGTVTLQDESGWA